VRNDNAGMRNACARSQKHAWRRPANATTNTPEDHDRADRDYRLAFSMRGLPTTQTQGLRATAALVVVSQLGNEFLLARQVQRKIAAKTLVAGRRPGIGVSDVGRSPLP